MGVVQYPECISHIRFIQLYINVIEIYGVVLQYSTVFLKDSDTLISNRSPVVILEFYKVQDSCATMIVFQNPQNTHIHSTLHSCNARKPDNSEKAQK